MDHVLVEIETDTEDAYLAAPSISSGSGSRSSMVVGHIPIEAQLRGLGLRLLYEVCRVQKLSLQDLSMFSTALTMSYFLTKRYAQVFSAINLSTVCLSL